MSNRYILLPNGNVESERDTLTWARSAGVRACFEHLEFEPDTELKAFVSVVEQAVRGQG